MVCVVCGATVFEGQERYDQRRAESLASAMRPSSWTVIGGWFRRRDPGEAGAGSAYDDIVHWQRHFPPNEAD